MPWSLLLLGFEHLHLTKYYSFISSKRGSQFPNVPHSYNCRHYNKGDKYHIAAASLLAFVFLMNFVLPALITLPRRQHTINEYLISGLDWVTWGLHTWQILNRLCFFNWQKIKNSTLIWSNKPTSGYISEGNEINILKRIHAPQCLLRCCLQ